MATESINSSNLVNLFLSATGFVGGLTGLMTVWINYLNYSKDNIKLKVKVSKGMKIFTPGQKPDEKTYLVINVSNLGIKTVTVNKAVFVCLKRRGGGILSSSMLYGNQKLDEGKSLDYMAEDQDIDYSDINYVAVYDSVGREYKCYMSRWYIRFWYWFLNFTHIKRKLIEAPSKIIKSENIK